MSDCRRNSVSYIVLLLGTHIFYEHTNNIPHCEYFLTPMEYEEDNTTLFSLSNNVIESELNSFGAHIV